MPDASCTLRDTDDLIAAGLLPASQRGSVEAVAQRYAIAVTPAMRALIEAPDDPIARQFIPDAAELLTAPHESPDPDRRRSEVAAEGRGASVCRPGAAEAAAGVSGVLPVLLPPRACRAGGRTADRGRTARRLCLVRRPSGDARGDPDRWRSADAVAAAAGGIVGSAVGDPAYRDDPCALARPGGRPRAA